MCSTDSVSGEGIVRVVIVRQRGSHSICRAGQSQRFCAKQQRLEGPVLV